MRDPAVPALYVACLCAAWCRTCDAYAAVFERAVAALRAPSHVVTSRWIDIEDEAALVGDFDVETFPTLVVADDRRVLFAGPLTPQPETAQRVLQAAADAARDGAAVPPAAAEVEAFVERWRAAASAASR